MGAHFHIPVIHSDTNELLSYLGAESVELWITDASGSRVSGVDIPARVAIALGNEGAGVSAPLREHAQRRVGLPLAPGVESLNVAVAAGIILYILRDGGGRA
jgi:TrmH family RNA methyltransferase